MDLRANLRKSIPTFSTDAHKSASTGELQSRSVIMRHEFDSEGSDLPRR
jgi:hypothetical protein